MVVTLVCMCVTVRFAYRKVQKARWRPPASERGKGRWVFQGILTCTRFCVPDLCLSCCRLQSCFLSREKKIHSGLELWSDQPHFLSWLGLGKLSHLLQFSEMVKLSQGCVSGCSPSLLPWYIATHRYMLCLFFAEQEALYQTLCRIQTQLHDNEVSWRYLPILMEVVAAFGAANLIVLLLLGFWYNKL